MIKSFHLQSRCVILESKEVTQNGPGTVTELFALESTLSVSVVVLLLVWLKLIFNEYSNRKINFLECIEKQRM